LEVTHPQQPFFISTKTFKSTTFVKTAAAALAAVTWVLKHNETPTMVTLPTGSSTIFHAVTTSKDITMHRNVLRTIICYMGLNKIAPKPLPYCLLGAF